MKNNNLIIFAVILVVVAAAAFFGGTQYQASKTSASVHGQNGFQMRFGNGTGGQAGLPAGQAGNQNFRPARGEILSIDNNSVTVKMTDGTSRIVILSDKTVYLKTSAGTKADLKTGMTINAIGTQNADGSVTAQDIQINPPAFAGGRNPTNRPSQ